MHYALNLIVLYLGKIKIIFYIKVRSYVVERKKEKSLV